MRYRRFGSSGLDISEIVFGAGAVGGAVFRGEPEQRLATVRRALEGGVNWIDTAPSYGDGESESNLGWILPELDADPHLSTKVRLRAEDLDDIVGTVRRSSEASLSRLRRDRVDLLQLHNPVRRERDGHGSLSIDDVLAPGGIADALGACRDEGLTALTGLTALGDVDVLHELVGSGRFDAVQVYHNILNPSATIPVPAGFSAVDYRELAVAAARSGIGVLNIRVLAAGVIGGGTGRGRAMSPGSEPERDAARARRLAHALEGEPGTLAQRAIRFALEQPGIAGVLVGFSNPEQVDEALAAIDLPPLSPAERERLLALYSEDVEPFG